MMDKKFVIVYYDTSGSKFYTAGNWVSISGPSHVHTSEPMDHYPTTEEIETNKPETVHWDYANIEQRYYKRGTV